MKKLASLAVTHALLISLLAPLAGAQQTRPAPASPAATAPPAPQQHARLDKAANRPQLTTHARLLRDGQLVYSGFSVPLQMTMYPDPKRIDIFGRLQLGSTLAPGEYVLQVIVTDTLRNDKHRVAT
ncbi:MAG TPA: hypothetical protein VGB76_11310 [Pyrinomonadaceae bacterium]|jgi:hypothetical protein